MIERPPRRQFVHSDPEPTITMFMGQNVDDMTREEAIATVKMLGTMYRRLLDQIQGDRGFYRALLGKERDNG